MQSRRDAALCAGWAIFMLSVSIATWDRPTESILGEGGDAFMFTIGLLRMVAFAAGFFVAYAVSLRSSCPSKVLLASSAPLMLAGLVLSHAPMALLPLDGTLLGLGSSFLFCAWQRIFARVCPDCAVPLLGVSSAIGAAMLLPLSATGYLGHAVDFSAGAGLVSLAICIVSSHQEGLLRADADGTNGSFAGPFPWKQVLCVGACAFIWQLVFALGLKDVGALVNIQVPFVVCQVLVAVVLSAVWARIERLPDAEAAFTPSFAVLTTGFLLMPFLGTWFRICFTAVTLFVFCLMSILMQGACIAVAQHEGADSSAVLGRFAGVVYLFMALGYAAGGAVQGSGELNVAHLLMLALVMTYALGVVFFLVRGRSRQQSEAPATAYLKRMELETPAVRDSAAAVLAQKAGLTERETEVLALVVKGRDLPSISQIMGLSKNTVRTHMRNLYRKLDVHSRQEIIDIIEGADG